MICTARCTSSCAIRRSTQRTTSTRPPHPIPAIPHERVRRESGRPGIHSPRVQWKEPAVLLCRLTKASASARRRPTSPPFRRRHADGRFFRAAAEDRHSRPRHDHCRCRTTRCRRSIPRRRKSSTCIRCPISPGPEQVNNYLYNGPLINNIDQGDFASITERPTRRIFGRFSKEDPATYNPGFLPAPRSAAGRDIRALPWRPERRSFSATAARSVRRNIMSFAPASPAWWKTSSSRIPGSEISPSNSGFPTPISAGPA